MSSISRSRARLLVLAALAALGAPGCPGPGLAAVPAPAEPVPPGFPERPFPGVEPGGFLDARVAGPAVTADVSPPPLSGGTLLVEGGTAVVGDPDRDRIVVVDLVVGRVIGEASLAPGSEPGRMTVDGAGRVHAALRGGGVFSFVPRRVEDGVVRGACPMPRGIAYDAEADLVRVACRGGELVSLAPATGEIVESVFVERDLRDVIAVDGRLFVTTFRAAHLIELAPDGTVADDRAPLAVTGFGRGFFDEVDGARRDGFPVFEPAVAWRAVEVRGARTIAMVHQRASGSEVRPEEGGYGAGGGMCESGIVQSTISFFSLDGDAIRGGAEISAATLPIDVATFGDEVSIVAAGNQAGARSVMTISAASTNLDPELVGPCAFASEYTLEDGSAPRGATALAYDGAGRLVVFERDPAALVYLGRRIPLGGPGVFDTGHAVFHGNAGAFVACASCHPEGGEDGRVWHFDGIGPRRTPAMHGDLRGTEPFHWDGDMTDLGVLVHEVFSGRMSGPELDPRQVDALGSWIDVLPRPVTDARDADAVARGREIFEGVAGCNRCHNGPNLTNNATVDVGTGGAFQVPSLIGVSYRLPVMHTGCATTLRARFEPTCGGGDLHGATSGLGEGQLSDLVAYLETL